MELALENRVIAVGGSSKGIGLAIARGALAEGARVVLSGRREESLEASRAMLADAHGPGRVHAIRADLATALGASAFVEGARRAFGQLDGLVLNAGSGSIQPGWQANAADWDKAFAANLWPAQRVLHEALPGLVAAGRGSVVVVASITGLESTEAPLPYSAAKAALVSFAKNLARSLGPQGIRVNSVAPGNVLFEGGRWQERLAADPAGVQSYLEREVPLQRFGTPTEIADAVVFLLSERASFVTGACLVADGGQTRGI